jgi:hypothetical protein
VKSSEKIQQEVSGMVDKGGKKNKDKKLKQKVNKQTRQVQQKKDRQPKTEQK